jgi:small GTP-binding protein
MMQKKICVVGSFGVGKTSLISRFVHSIFSDRYLVTIGVKIDTNVIQVDDQTITLVLWDFAGEDAVTQIRTSHLQGASGHILVADGARSNTLRSAIDILNRIQQNCGPLPFVLAVNKADLQSTWEIRESELDELSQQGWPVFRTSARTGAGVEDMFLALTVKLLKEDHARTPSQSADRIA